MARPRDRGGPKDWFPRGGPPGSIRRFIDDHGVTMTYERVDWNPNYDRDDSWARSATHYKVTLKRPGKRMTLHYSIGNPEDRPEADDVLDTLASDAAGYENSRGGFGEWADEYGFDPDSRSAERTFKAVEKQAERLKKFLGDEAYEKLLWETERE